LVIILCRSLCRVPLSNSASGDAWQCKQWKMEALLVEMLALMTSKSCLWMVTSSCWSRPRRPRGLLMVMNTFKPHTCRPTLEPKYDCNPDSLPGSGNAVMDVMDVGSLEWSTSVRPFDTNAFGAVSPWNVLSVLAAMTCWRFFVRMSNFTCNDWMYLMISPTTVDLSVCPLGNK